MNEFVNRDNERQKFNKALEQHEQLVMIQSLPRIGNTFFIEYFIERIKNNQNITLYIKYTTNDIFKNLFHIYLETYGSELCFKISAIVKAIDDENYNSGILDNLIADSPFFPNSLLHFKKFFSTEQKLEGTKKRDKYLYFFEQLLKKLAEDNKKISIFIEDAGSVPEPEMDKLIFLLKENANLFITLVFTKNCDNKTKISNQWHDFSQNEPYKIELESPDEHMIKLLSEKCGCCLSDEELNDYCVAYHGQIHELMHYLRNKQDISMVHKKILYILEIINVEVEKKDLYEIVKKLHQNVISLEEFNNKIIDLEVEGYIKQKDMRIEALRKSVKVPFSDLLHCKHFIVEFYSGHFHGRDRFLLNKILKLAKEMNYKQIISKNFMHYLASQNIKNSDNFMDYEELVTIFNSEDFSGFRNICISLFINSDFVNAYAIMKENEQMVYLDIQLTLLYGIAANRVRKHVVADNIYEKLLNKELSLDIKTIVISYAIINSIYLNDLAKSKNLFSKYKEETQESKYHIYLQRNYMSVLGLDEENTADKLKTIISQYSGNDEFALGTMHCNLARAYLSTGKLEDGKENLDIAYKKLFPYKCNNISILENNTAIYYMLIKNFPVANGIFLSAGEKAINELQKDFIMMNLAVSKYMLGEQEQSLDILNDIENNKLPYTDNRHFKEVYYSIRTLIEFYSNSTELEKYLVELKKYKNILKISKIDKSINIYEQYINSDIANIKAGDYWYELYLPNYLVYWYIDPLQLKESVDF